MLHASELLRFKASFATALAALTLTACGSSSSDSPGSGSSQAYSYEMSENNCPTGKHTFADKGSYCSALKDDAKNNFCARSLRDDVYNLECAPAKAAPAADATREKPQTLGSDGKSSKNLQTPTEQFGTIPGPKPLGAQEQAEPGAKALPDSVHVRAQSLERMTVSPKTSGDQMITTLSGKLVVKSTVPDLNEKNLNLIGATALKIVDPEISGCDLTVTNFSATQSVENVKQIDFTLMGIDPTASANQNGCLVKLSTMAMSGFSVEFENVRLGGVLNAQTIPKVRLDVSPAASP